MSGHEGGRLFPGGRTWDLRPGRPGLLFCIIRKLHLFEKMQFELSPPKSVPACKSVPERVCICTYTQELLLSHPLSLLLDSLSLPAFPRVPLCSKNARARTWSNRWMDVWMGGRTDAFADRRTDGQPEIDRSIDRPTDS